MFFFTALLLRLNGEAAINVLTRAYEFETGAKVFS